MFIYQNMLYDCGKLMSNFSGPFYVILVFYIFGAFLIKRIKLLGKAIIGARRLVGYIFNNREFKKTTTATATKGLMSRTMAVHVRYNSWYISLPSFAKKQREMTKFCVVWRTCTTTANFLNLFSEFNAVFHIQFRGNFDSEKQTK